MKNVMSFLRFQMENVVLVAGYAVSWLLSPSFEILLAGTFKVMLMLAYILVVLSPLILSSFV